MRNEHHKDTETGITVLYLLYPGAPGYRKERPIRELHRILGRIPGKKTIVYIDNSSPDQPPEQVGRREYAIGGNNAHFEFSGWQKGLDFLRREQPLGDVCLLANDTLLSHSRYHRRLLNRTAVECARNSLAMVGKRMTLGADGDILGNPLIPYIRTHLFLMPTVAVNALGSVVSLDDAAIDRLFLRSFDPAIPLFRTNAPISGPIRDYIFFHLQSAWHRKMPYTGEHFADLRGKATSILNALLLSMRVYQLGYPLVSFAKASWLTRTGATPEQMRAEWIDGHTRAHAHSENAPNRFWREDSARYRNIPARKHPFTLENLLDFLERREHPEHL